MRSKDTKETLDGRLRSHLEEYFRTLVTFWECFVSLRFLARSLHSLISELVDIQTHRQQ